MTDEGRDMRSRRLVLAAAVVLVAAVAAAFAAPASSGDREVRRAGVCDGAATSKIKLKAENGRIEVEFEVDQNRNGRSWTVTLRRNGNRFFRGVRTTHAPSGSFEVRRLTTNGAGPDKITARAVAHRNGQVCKASATW
jgi:hypothetical protein